MSRNTCYALVLVLVIANKGGAKWTIGTACGTKVSRNDGCCPTPLLYSLAINACHGGAAFQLALATPKRHLPRLPLASVAVATMRLPPASGFTNCRMRNNDG